MTIRIQVPRRVRSCLPRDGTSATVTTAKSRTPLRLFFFSPSCVWSGGREDEVVELWVGGEGVDGEEG